MDQKNIPKLTLMNLKSTLLILVCCIPAAIQTKAQDSSFQLRDYKYRTPGFRALQLDLNLDGGVSNSTFENWNNFKSRSFQTSPYINYFKIISSDKRQHTSNLFLDPFYNSAFSGTDTSKTKSRSSSLSFSWNRMDRFFFSNNYFFEAGNNFSIAGNSNYQSQQNFTRRSEAGSFQNKLKLGVGKGRLENVQDAQMAMFIVNDLKKMGLLQYEITGDKLNELAKLITDINNRRVFDSRIRRIYELSKIDSFFQSNNLVKGSSIALFTAINDNWALAFNPGRQAGTIYYFRFNPSFQWNRNSNKENTALNNFKSTQKEFAYAYEPEIGFEKQKPVNLFWQKSMGASLSFVQEWRRNKSDYENSSNPPQPTINNNTAASYLSFTAFYGVGYYPNNRTIINAGLNLNSFLLVNSTNGQNGDFDVKPGLFLNANYFVNYRTRVFLNASSSYYFYNPNVVPTPTYIYQSSRFDANISVGFSHIIF